MHKHANVVWELPNKLTDWTQASAAVLMDIRHELRELNRKVDIVRSCPTVLAALQGAVEVGRDVRRKERAKRKRRKV